jgi:hypothetical protein
MMIRDTLVMALMVVVHGLAILASRRVLERRWFTDKLHDASIDGKRWEMVAGQIVLIWSAIVGGAFLLNAVGLLSPLALYGVVALVSVGGIWWTTVPITTEPLTTEPMALATGDAVGNVVPAANAVGSGDAFAKLVHGSGLLLLAALGIGQVLLFGIWEFPIDWDTLAYHLPVVDHWVQTGSLANQRCAFWYVPGNGELLGYWFSGPLSGDYFAQLSNVPVAVLLVVSLLGICERWDIDRTWQLILVVLVVASQVMLRQLTSLENDLAAGALFAASLMFGLSVVNRGNKNPEPMALATGDSLGKVVPAASAVGSGCFGASVGLLAGVKYYSIGYAAVAIIACILTLIVYRGWRAAIRVAAVALGGCVMLGGYWYFRNYWLGGSPLFPLGFPLMGFTDQWANMRPESVSSTLIRGSTPEVWWLLLTAWLVQAGPFALVALLLSPAFGMVGIWLWYWRKQKPSPPAPLPEYRERGESSPSRWVAGEVVEPAASAVGSVFLSLALLGCVAVYLVTPNVIETESGSRNMLRMQYHSVRFGYCFAILCLLFWVKVSNVAYRWLYSKKQNLIAYALLGGSVLFSVGNLVWHLLPQYGWRNTLRDLTGLGVFFRYPQLDYPALEWALVTIDLFLALILVRVLVKSTRVRFTIIGVLMVLWTPWMAKAWHDGYDEYYQTLNQTRLPIGLRMLSESDRFCIGAYRYYPILGSDRSGIAHRPLFLPTPEALKAYLSENRINFVAAPHGDSHWSESYAKMLDYMNSWEDEFIQVDDVDGFVIFQRKNQLGVDK